MTDLSLQGSAVSTKPDDPRRGFTRAQVKAMCEGYMTPGRTVKEVAKSFRISADRLRELVRLEGCKLRGRDFAIRQSRGRLGKSTLGPRNKLGMWMPPLPPLRITGSVALERAKTVLRKRGMVVFDATVDGSGGKGIVKCDGQLYTAEQIIERAGQ